MRNTSFADEETLAVNDTGWKKFMRKVSRFEGFTSNNDQSKERMTRKAVVDTLDLEFPGGMVMCLHCQMEDDRSGLAVHFARCSRIGDTEEKKLQRGYVKREEGGPTFRSNCVTRRNIHKESLKILSQKKGTILTLNSERRASSIEGGTSRHTASTTFLSGRNGSAKN